MQRPILEKSLTITPDLLPVFEEHFENAFDEASEKTESIDSSCRHNIDSDE